MEETKKQLKRKSDSGRDEKYYEQKILELFRQIIGSVTLEEITLPEEFDAPQRQEIARFCHQVYHNPYFDIIIKALFYPIIMFAAQQAPDYPSVTFSRASANGVHLVEEMFHHWSNIYDTEYAGREENFDPNKPFEPTVK